MKGSLTQSMAWLHTWGGLVFGWLLFAVFFTGTLSVFPIAITAWMQPELHEVRHASHEETVALAVRTLEDNARLASQWTIRMPNEERPLLTVGWRTRDPDGSTVQRQLDPATGAAMHPRRTLGGGFFVRFHFSLLMGRTGQWLVGAAVMMMLAAIVSGVIIHKKIFKDFFTFRPAAPGHRAWLDAHTLAGVFMLPFHVMISYTGLIIFVFTFMPAGIQMLFDGDRQAYARELRAELGGEPTRLRRPAAGMPAPMVPLGDLIERIEAEWGLPITSVTVDHPGDLHATVRLAHFSRSTEQVFGTEQAITLDGATGTVLRPTDGPQYLGAQGVRQTSFTLHTARLGGIGMKWLYFLMSAASCVVIGTGLVMWTISAAAE